MGVRSVAGKPDHAVGADRQAEAQAAGVRGAGGVYADQPINDPIGVLPGSSGRSARQPVAPVSGVRNSYAAADRKPRSLPAPLPAQCCVAGVGRLIWRDCRWRSRYRGGAETRLGVKGSALRGLVVSLGRLGRGFGVTWGLCMHCRMVGGCQAPSGALKRTPRPLMGCCWSWPCGLRADRPTVRRQCRRLLHLRGRSAGPGPWVAWPAPSTCCRGGRCRAPRRCWWPADTTGALLVAAFTRFG